MLSQVPTLCNPMDCSMPGFPVLHYLPGLAQIHVHWVSDAISPPHPLLPLSPFAFNLSQHQGPSQWVYLCLKERKVKMKSFSRVRLFVTPWTIAYQAPPSMGFSRQEYWSGLPVPSPPIAETHTNIKDLTHENVCQIAQRFHVIRFRPLRVMSSHIFDHCTTREILAFIL